MANDAFPTILSLLAAEMGNHFLLKIPRGKIRIPRILGYASIVEFRKFLIQVLHDNPGNIG